MVDEEDKKKVRFFERENKKQRERERNIYKRNGKVSQLLDNNKYITI